MRPKSWGVRSNDDAVLEGDLHKSTISRVFENIVRLFLTGFVDRIFFFFLLFYSILRDDSAL